MKQNNNKIKVLVCGSQKFDDQSFVFGILNTFFETTHGAISTVFTSKFSGTCAYAKTWLNTVNEHLPAEKQIHHGDCTFDMHLAKQNLSFFDEANIPEFLIQSDPFFQEGKEKLISKGVNMVLMFPNEEGVVGASTKNIMRFAKLANIKFMDCTEIYDAIKAQRGEMVIQEPKEETSLLQNQHGMKRI